MNKSKSIQESFYFENRKAHEKMIPYEKYIQGEKKFLILKKNKPRPLNGFKAK